MAFSSSATTLDITQIYIRVRVLFTVFTARIDAYVQLQLTMVELRAVNTTSRVLPLPALVARAV